MQTHILRSMALLVLLSCGAEAQVRNPTPIAASKLVERVVDTNSVAAAQAGEAIVSALTAPDVSSARKDSISQGLRDIALTPGRPGVQSDAVTWLVLSARRGTKTPYPKATEILIEIYRDAADIGTRSGALRGLAKVGNARAVKFVAGVIEEEGLQNKSLLPMFAVEALASYGDQSGREVLRQIFSRGQVQDERARDMLLSLSKTDFRTKPR